MNKQKNILAVGSIAIDTLETPRGNCSDLLGGSASYFSVAASMLAPVKLVGVVGDQGKPCVVSLSNRAPESRTVDIPNLEVFKESSLPTCFNGH